MNKEKNGRLFVPAWCTRGISIAIHSILIMQISYYATESAGTLSNVVKRKQKPEESFIFFV